MQNLVSLLMPKLLYMYLTSIYIHCLHCYSTWRPEMQRNSKKFHSKLEQFLYIFQAMHCESTGSGACSMVRNDQSDKLIYSAHRFPGSLFDQLKLMQFGCSCLLIEKGKQLIDLSLSVNNFFPHLCSGELILVHLTMNNLNQIIRLSQIRNMGNCN